MQREVVLDLTSGSPPPPPPVYPPRVRIDVTSEGLLLWDGRPVSVIEMEALMSAAAKANADVTIWPEKLAHSRDVMAVMNSIRHHGLSKMAIVHHEN